MAVRCDYEALVWVTLSEVTRTTMLAFEAAIQDVANITEANRMMGQPDYLLRVVARDSHAFEELYMDVLAALPHVQKLTSQLAMKIVKRTHELPIETTAWDEADEERRPPTRSTGSTAHNTTPSMSPQIAQSGTSVLGNPPEIAQRVQVASVLRSEAG